MHAQGIQNAHFLFKHGLFTVFAAVITILKVTKNTLVGVMQWKENHKRGLFHLIMHHRRCKLIKVSIYRKISSMNQKQKHSYPPQHQERLERLAIALKEMRFSEGRKQDGYNDEGITRRRIQRAEYGNNLTLVSLFSLLDCYGYSLSDLDIVE
jgi:hypothetical protein